MMGEHLGIPYVVDFPFLKIFKATWLFQELFFTLNFLCFDNADVYIHTTLKAPVLV